MYAPQWNVDHDHNSDEKISEKNVKIVTIQAQLGGTLPLLFLSDS